MGFPNKGQYNSLEISYWSCLDRPPSAVSWIPGNLFQDCKFCKLPPKVWGSARHISYDVLGFRHCARAASQTCDSKKVMHPDVGHTKTEPFDPSLKAVLLVKRRAVRPRKSCIVKPTSQNHTRRRGTTSRNLKLCWYHWVPGFWRWISFVSQHQHWGLSLKASMFRSSWLTGSSPSSSLSAISSLVRMARRRNRSVPIHSWILSWSKVWISCRSHKSQNADGKTAARS